MRIAVFNKILVLIFISISIVGFGQDRCSHSMKSKFAEAVNIPTDAYEKSFIDWKKKRKTSVRSNVVVTIPVHVVIVHPTGQPIGTGDNLSMERIQSQIDVLNQDFPGINSDISDVPSMFDVGMSDISFCLATVDPDGNPTDGVTRYATDLNYDDNFMSIIMPETIWDNSLYLNIYVTSTIQDLGFSPVPSTQYTIPPQWDAPTVLTASFGGPGFATQQNYDLGRTAVHEIGHWLGLNHVWGPGGGGCSEDDGMDDTPTQEQPNYFCPNHPLPSCGNPAIFFMNFMDYVDDDCMLAFSEDQVDYMHFIIEEVRPGLIGAHLSKCEGLPPPDPIVVTVLSTADESCAGANNGSAEFSASGGTPPYSFSLDGVNFQADSSFDNLAGANYTVTVQDATSASQTANFSIGTAAQIFIEIVAVTNPCGGMPNGSFGVVATGGNVGDLSITVNQSMTDPNNFFSNLSAGVYNITVTDSQNCIEQIEFDLTNAPNQIAIDIVNVVQPCGTNPNGSFEVVTTNNIGVTVNQTMTDPNNAFSDLVADEYVITAQDAQGCTSELTYNLEVDPDPFEPIELDILYPSASECETDPNSVSVEFISSAGDGINNITLDNGMNTTMGLISGLSAGTYTYTASNAEGCQETGSFSIEDNYYYDLEFELIDPSCFNTSNGALSFENNTSLPILIQLSQGESSGPASYTSIPPGLHSLTVYGMDNCILIEEDIEFTVDQIIEIGISVDADCVSGLTTIDFSASGGTGTLNYELNGEVNTTGIFENLNPGNVNLVVTDENSCQENFQIEILPVDGVMTVITNIEDEFICSGESTQITLEVSGGSTPYTYLFNGIPQPSNVIQNVGGGSHTIEVLSSSNCAEDFETEIEIIEFEALVVEDVIITDSECSDEGGFFEASIFDGSPPYYYILDQVDTIFVDDLPRLEDGDHSIQVIDSEGCRSEVFEFETTVSSPVFVDVTILNHVSCFGLDNGKIELDVESSIGVSSYDWNIENINPQQMMAGEYSLTVTNPAGCTAVADFEITQPDSMIIESEVLTPAGNLAGSAEFTVAGGTPPYEFNVDGIENEDGFFSLLQGDYTVDITDAIGCNFSHDFTILLESSTNDISSEFGIKIGPNPTNDFLKVNCAACVKNSSYSIYNLQGKLELDGGIGLEETLQVANLGQGVYLLVIEVNGQVATKRFVVL